MVKEEQKKSEKKVKNEFNQDIKGNSLGRDAWRRLKKNKMAVISIFVVVLYAFLSLFASVLPIYSYKEIILDHQHLRPSFTKTAGELMLEKKKKDIYFMAYKNGRVEISDEDRAAVKEMSPNQVWDYFYALGESGGIELNASEKRTLERMEEKIKTELLFETSKLTYVDDAGKKTKIDKLSLEELAGLYESISGISAADTITIAERSVTQQITNRVKTESDSLSDIEVTAAIEKALEDTSEAEFIKMQRVNIISMLETEVKSFAKDSLAESVKDPNVIFPLKDTLEVSKNLTAVVTATKKHERRYYLGTDYSGRDMLSRIIYGGQVSIAIGLIGTLTSVIIGIILGALAGYLGGKVDYIIMRIVDIMYGLPYMLLVIIFMAIFGRNIMNLFFALAIVSWLTVARMVRGQIISLKNSEFVEAARSMGASTNRIVFRHLVPNSLSVIIVFATLRIPSFIMMESFLSFLGLGVQAPFASWGSLVGDAVEGMTLYTWRLIFPAIAMTVFLFAMNFLGDGLRDAFDPQSKNQL